MLAKAYCSARKHDAQTLNIIRQIVNVIIFPSNESERETKDVAHGVTWSDANVYNTTRFYILTQPSRLRSRRLVKAEESPTAAMTTTTTCV